MRAPQQAFPALDEFFLSQRLEESRALVKDVAERSEKPLVVQFSGGKDSMALVGLVREVTDNFVCFYMESGLELPGTVEFVRGVADHLGVPIMFSDPSVYKGGFFERIATFKTFPTMVWLWCAREKRHLMFWHFYKLNGVRKAESARRKVMYGPVSKSMVREDPEHKGSVQVFPLLNWTFADVSNYLDKIGLPVSEDYRRFGVSGCGWCPFYGAEIYEQVLREFPDFYDRFIEWENRLAAPSVLGYIWLSELKEEVLGYGKR